MRYGRFLPLAALAAALTLVACTDQSPTGPAQRFDSQVLTAQSSDEKAEHERLKEQRDAVRKAQKEKREEMKALRATMREEWKSYKDALAKEKKLTKHMTVEFLRCEPQDYSGDAEVIGPNGGELRMGHHKLIIPKGALDREVLVVGEAPVSELVEVQFSPHGLKFKRPVELVLSYSHCIIPPAYTYRIVYVGEDGKQILEFPPSKDDKSIKEVEALIGHFSGYIVAF
jgi:hypothetical protein